MKQSACTYVLGSNRKDENNSKNSKVDEQSRLIKEKMLAVKKGKSYKSNIKI